MLPKYLLSLLNTNLSNKQNNLQRGRGIFSHVPSERWKISTPIAFLQHLFYWQHVSSVSIQDKEKFFSYTFKRSPSEMILKKINSCNNFYTWACKFYCSRQYYLALSFRTFNKFICTRPVMFKTVMFSHQYLLNQCFCPFRTRHLCKWFMQAIRQLKI